MLGFEDSLKPLKKALRSAGADVNRLRDWQKTYDKVNRQAPLLEKKYAQAKQELEAVHGILQRMEQVLITSRDSKELAALAKELRKYQTVFDHEFLISKADTDFHTTYATLLGLCEKNSTEEGERLILQSEVENLLALTKEALVKELPDYHAMAFYYIERSDREISDLPHSDKVAKVRRVYENEFLQPMRTYLANYNMVLEDWVWN